MRQSNFALGLRIQVWSKAAAISPQGHLMSLEALSRGCHEYGKVGPIGNIVAVQETCATQIFNRKLDVLSGRMPIPAVPAVTADNYRIRYLVHVLFCEGFLGIVTPHTIQAVFDNSCQEWLYQNILDYVSMLRLIEQTKQMQEDLPPAP